MGIYWKLLLMMLFKIQSLQILKFWIKFRNLAREVLYLLRQTVSSVNGCQNPLRVNQRKIDFFAGFYKTESATVLKPWNWSKYCNWSWARWFSQGTAFLNHDLPLHKKNWEKWPWYVSEDSKHKIYIFW